MEKKTLLIGGTMAFDIYAYKPIKINGKVVTLSEMLALIRKLSPVMYETITDYMKEHNIRTLNQRDIVDILQNDPDFLNLLFRELGIDKAPMMLNCSVGSVDAGCVNQKPVIGKKYKVACVPHHATLYSEPKEDPNKEVGSALAGTVYTVRDAKQDSTGTWWALVGTTGNYLWIQAYYLEPTEDGGGFWGGLGSVLNSLAGAFTSIFGGKQDQQKSNWFEDWMAQQAEEQKNTMKTLMIVGGVGFAGLLTVLLLQQRK